MYQRTCLFDNLKPTWQCVKEPTNKVEKNAVAVVRTNSHCEKDGWHCATEISMIVSMFLSLLHCALDVFATGKLVNHGGACGLEIPAIFLFYAPEKIIKLAKDEITKLLNDVYRLVSATQRFLCESLNVVSSAEEKIVRCRVESSHLDAIEDVHYKVSSYLCISHAPKVV